jgi:hypothetical protein
MPENSEFLSFFAIVNTAKNELDLKRIRLSQKVQKDLSEDFFAQAKTFLDLDLKRIAVDQFYSPDDSEIFVIQNYPMNKIFVKALKSPEGVPDLKLKDEEIGKIKSIFGGLWNSHEDKAEIYFQAFNRARVIEPESSLFFKDNIFQKLDSRGIRLDDKLIAVFKNRELLFFSGTIKSFLDISEYYKEATDAEIKSVLEHPHIDTAEVDKIISQANTWVRKRFSGIIQSKVMDEVSPREIKKRGKEFGVEVEIVKKKGKEAVQFPKEKSQIKDFLKLLNEEYFVGILSNNRFETNSKRKIKEKE